MGNTITTQEIKKEEQSPVKNLKNLKILSGIKNLIEDEKLLKPQKKKYITNEFNNLEKFVIENNKKYFLEDLNKYEKNLNDETNKIIECYPDIFVTSLGEDIKKNVYDQIQNNIKQIKIEQKIASQFKHKNETLEDLDKLDINSKEFYTDIALTCKKNQKRAYSFYEKWNEEF